MHWGASTESTFGGMRQRDRRNIALLCALESEGGVAEHVVDLLDTVRQYDCR